MRSFLSIISNVVHGTEKLGNEIIKTVNSTVKNTAQVNNIKNRQWTGFYKSLWYNLNHTRLRKMKWILKQ
jgi:hypothetical protein